MKRQSEVKRIALVEKAEEDNIARRLLTGLSKCPYLPDNLYRGTILYETMAAEQVCMAVSVIQGAYISRQYILGGHEAKFPFKLIYRILPGSSIDARLEADETLNKIGRWVSENLPNLGEGIRAVSIKTDSRSTMFAAYEGGDEDHQILQTLTYEVV